MQYYPSIIGQLPVISLSHHYRYILIYSWSLVLSTSVESLFRTHASSFLSLLSYTLLQFMIVGIPSLVLINPKSGVTITTAGTTVVQGDREGDKFPWPEAHNTSSMSSGPTMQWLLLFAALYWIYRIFY